MVIFMKNQPMKKHILITGANSGIGAALAKIYAGKDISLYLTARNEERLSLIASECKALGADIEIFVADISDKNAIRNWVENIPKLDLVIANAGISGGTGDYGESEQQLRQIFEVNIMGVVNVIYPAIEKMKLQNHGQIAIISSLAGFRGLPSAPAYSASKGCVKILSEALRGELAKYDIKVNAITPGYIDTPMTKVNNFPMPFLLSPKKAAEIIKLGLSKNRSRIAFPFPLYFMIWLASCLPNFITDFIFAKLPPKY